MITPTLNINGSSAHDLIEPRQQAWKLLDDVVEALQQITPNGRDYPGNSTALMADRVEHYLRIEDLRDLQATLLREALHIKDQDT